MVHGGQQPVNGAKIYLLAASPNGYGSSSLSLLTSALTGNAVDSIGAYGTTDPNGNFSVSGDYSCTTGYSLGASTASGGTTLPGNEQVYLYVLGGNPGLGTGANSSIGLLAALGPCNAQFSSTLQVNEITTVAAAYALAGFATDATHISSSGSALALTGLTNAGLNSQNLANVATGTVAKGTSNRAVPSGNIITIANMLAACINGASGSSSCNKLFGYTQSAGASGTPPTDTATAAINLAHNPNPTATGISTLYGLTSPSPAFAGGLTGQPNDFTLGLYLTNSGCFNNGARGIAIDAAGSAWSLGGHGLCKFTSNGTAVTPGSGYTGGGYTAGLNLAIDTYGNVWVPNYSSNLLSEFSNSGSPLSGTGYTGGGLNTPYDVAIDASGNVWVANQQGTLSKFSSGGSPTSGTNGYSDGGSLVAFYGLAIDVSGNVWATNYNNGSLSKFNNNGGAVSPTTGYGGGGLEDPWGIAIDASGNVWAANNYGNSLSKFKSDGTPVSPSGTYGGYGGLSSPVGVAIDSAGNVWSANAEFTNGGTRISPGGYSGGGSVYSGYRAAIDGSGDVWIPNSDGTLGELIGAASPVVTPLAANLVSPYGSATVNRP